MLPYAGTDAHDTYLIGERAEFHASPSIRIAGARVLELSGMGVDDMCPSGWHLLTTAPERLRSRIEHPDVLACAAISGPPATPTLD